MLEEILDYRNVQKALKQVISNHGAGGVDGMQTGELREYVEANWSSVKQRILEGSYRPAPVRKVEIPKADGGKRMLGIPTVLDRLWQQAISQWMSPVYEAEFSENSFGYREGRNAHQAVNKAKEYLQEGKEWVVELDLEKFFDRVNHDKLMGLLAKRIADKRTLKLIRSYLNSGIMEGGLVSQRMEGTPQGSPLSPLWKRPKTRMENLLRLGVNKWQSRLWAGSSLGCCRIAKSQVLKTPLNNKYFQKLGYVGFSNRYYWKTEHQLKLF